MVLDEDFAEPGRPFERAQMKSCNLAVHKNDSAAVAKVQPEQGWWCFLSSDLRKIFDESNNSRNKKTVKKS